MNGLILAYLLRLLLGEKWRVAEEADVKRALAAFVTVPVVLTIFICFFEALPKDRHDVFLGSGFRAWLTVMLMLGVGFGLIALLQKLASRRFLIVSSFIAWCALGLVILHAV